MLISGSGCGTGRRAGQGARAEMAVSMYAMSGVFGVAVGKETRMRVLSIRLDQEVFGTQTRSALTKAFAVSMSLRMSATMATIRDWIMVSYE